MVDAAARGSGHRGRDAPPHQPSRPSGLIFGHATVNEQAIAEGIDILARVISEP